MKIGELSKAAGCAAAQAKFVRRWRSFDTPLAGRKRLAEFANSETGACYRASQAAPA